MQKELASKFCSYDPENFIKTSYGIISDNIINEFF